MNVMVADTSVLIDLETGNLLERCFGLPFQFTVPDLLYRRDLASRDEGPEFSESLLALGLKVEELNETEVSRAVRYHRENNALSLPDSFALALAASRKWMLLTGDGALRTLAMTLDVVCHGVLWLLDQIFDAGVSDPEELATGLRAIRDHPRCRLPQNEVQDRLRIYSAC